MTKSSAQFTDDTESSVSSNQMDLDYLKRLLLLASLEISKKNKLLSEIHKLIRPGSSQDNIARVNSIIQTELGNQENVNTIEIVRINKEFFERLNRRFPNLSEADRQLCVYCLANLPSKDIAIIRGVQIKTVEMARYRLRLKLHIPKDQSISTFLSGMD